MSTGDGPRVPSRDGGSVLLAACSVAYLLWTNLALPASVRGRLVARYPDPAPLTLFTSSYVHANGYDVVGNLAVYVSVVVVCLSLYSRLDGERAWFRLTFLGTFFFLPVCITLTNGAAFDLLYGRRRFVSYGFSGITAGFVGFAWVLSAVLVSRRHSRKLAGYVGAFVGVFALGVAVLLSARFRRVWVAALLFGAGGALLVAIGRALGSSWEGGSGRVEGSLGPLVSVAGVLVFVTLLFLPEAGYDGGTNVYAHLGGFVGGSLLSVATFVATRR